MRNDTNTNRQDAPREIAASSALDGEETILLDDGDRFDLMEFRGIQRDDDERDFDEFDNWRAEEERYPSRA